MSTIRVLLLTCLLLTGCALTPTQKKVVAISAGVLVVGAIAAHQVDHKPDEIQHACACVPPTRVGL
jgi:hypothetical protein